MNVLKISNIVKLKVLFDLYRMNSKGYKPCFFGRHNENYLPINFFVFLVIIFTDLREGCFV